MKQKLEADRKKMKEDIMNKKKEMMKNKGDFKVEIVGLPPNMMASEADVLIE
jgi:hypothetical protein